MLFCMGNNKLGSKPYYQGDFILNNFTPTGFIK